MTQYIPESPEMPVERVEYRTLGIFKQIVFFGHTSIASVIDEFERRHQAVDLDFLYSLLDTLPYPTRHDERAEAIGVKQDAAFARWVAVDTEGVIPKMAAEAKAFLASRNCTKEERVSQPLYARTPLAQLSPDTISAINDSHYFLDAGIGASWVYDAHQLATEGILPDSAKKISPRAFLELGHEQAWETALVVAEGHLRVIMPPCIERVLERLSGQLPMRTQSTKGRRETTDDRKTLDKVRRELEEFSASTDLLDNLEARRDRLWSLTRAVKYHPEAERVDIYFAEAHLEKDKTCRMTPRIPTAY